MCTTPGLIGFYCNVAVDSDVAVANITHVEVTLDTDLDTIPAGSPAREAFVEAFIQDVSSLLNIESGRVQIERIMAGSVIVVFAILPDEVGIMVPPLAIALLDTPTLTLAGIPASGIRTVTEAPPPPPTVGGANEDGDDVIGASILAAIIGIAIACGVAFVIHRRATARLKQQHKGHLDQQKEWHESQTKLKLEQQAQLHHASVAELTPLIEPRDVDVSIATDIVLPKTPDEEAKEHHHHHHRHHREEASPHVV